MYFLGCLYRVADSSDDEVFCFMENGDYPSQCLGGITKPTMQYIKKSNY